MTGDEMKSLKTISCLVETGLLCFWSKYHKTIGIAIVIAIIVGWAQIKCNAPQDENYLAERQAKFEFLAEDHTTAEQLEFFKNRN